MFKLLDVSVHWPPSYQSFVEGRLRALSKQGVEITVVTSHVGKLDRSLLPYARIIRVPHGRERRLTLLVRTLLETAKAFALTFRRTLELVRLGRSLNPSVRRFLAWWASAVPLVKAEPDVIHFEWNSAAITHEWMPVFMSCSYVVSCRGRQVNILPHLPGQEEYRKKLARSFRRASAVHGVSQHILREAVTLGLEPDKGRAIYTSVDTAFFRPKGEKKNALPARLISAGVSMWRKGYEYLLLTLKEVVEAGHDVVLEIADFDGPEQERVLFTARDLGIADRVKLLGKLSHEQLRERLWSCDIFVSSSLSEGVSNAVVEGMACGLPVITTDCGGMSEAVTNGVEGFVVPTRDYEAMAQAIIRLLEEPDLRRRMGAAGVARVSRQFLPEQQARQFLSLYEQVLGAS